MCLPSTVMIAELFKANGVPIKRLSHNLAMFPDSRTLCLEWNGRSRWSERGLSCYVVGVDSIYCISARFNGQRESHFGAE